MSKHRLEIYAFAVLLIFGNVPLNFLFVVIFFHEVCRLEGELQSVEGSRINRSVQETNRKPQEFEPMSEL